MKLKAGVLLLFSCLVCSTYLGADAGSAWRETSTEHFIFIYRNSDSFAVRELVSFCEEAYKLVADFFSSYPTQIRCVVYGNTDLANGFYNFPPHHIALYVAAPTSPWMGFGHENWLKLVLIHELTHYIHLRAEKGFFAALAVLFGDGLKGADTFFLPGWMIEGITTNSETIFSKGGRGRNPFFEIYYKAPLLEDHFFTLAQAEYSSPFPPPGRIYVAGYIFINFLLDNFGKETLLAIEKEYEQWPFFGPWRAIATVTGFSAEELFARMKDHLREKYRDDLKLPGGELVTPQEFADYTLPVITEQGWYLYRSNLTAFPALVQFDPLSKKETVLFETVLTDEYSFTADNRGDLLVFASPDYIRNTRLIDSATTSDLYVYNKATGGVSRLTRRAHLYHPALSGDGKSLVAVQRTGSYSRLVEVDMASGRLSLLFAEEGTSVYNPAFSPDGRLIVFGLDRRGVPDLYILPYPQEKMPLEGDKPLFSHNTAKIRVVLGPDDAGEYYPRFSDNDTLLFSSDRGGSLALYSFSLSTNEFILLCEEPVAAMAGLNLADGLLYASYSWRGFCVKKMPTEKLVHKKITLPPPMPIPKLQEPGEITGTDYIDWPIFQFWLPFPAAKLIASEEILWGGGVCFFGASPLGTTSYNVMLSLFPLYWQPEGTIALQTALGALDINYELDLSYRFTVDDRYEQSIRQTLALSLPLLAEERHNTANNISVFGGLSYSYDLFSPESFYFLEASTGTENELDFVAGGNVSIVKGGGIIDYYAPLAFKGDVFIQVPLPVFPESEQGFHTVTVLALNLPTFIPHAVLKAGCKASFTTEKLLGYPVVQPRGLFNAEPQTTEGRVLFSLDLLFPLALLDQPLFGGLHIDGMGAGLHAETLANFQVREEYFNFDKYVYVGWEFVVIIGLGRASIPAGVGVSVRIDPLDPQSLAADRDIRPYFFLGFDSFFAAARF